MAVPKRTRSSRVIAKPIRRRTEESTAIVQRARKGQGVTKPKQVPRKKAPPSRTVADPSKVTVDDLSGRDDTSEDVQAVHLVQQLFNALRDEAVKSEQERAAQGKVNKVKDTSLEVSRKAKKNEARTEAVILAQRAKVKAAEVKNISQRPDLVALSRMNREKLTLLKGAAAVGRIRGILPGDRFFSRAELAVVDLHSKWLSGIDFLTEKDSPFGKSVCTAICISGGYEDDVDLSTEIEYTGQGGNDLLGKRGQFKDQIMESGNLALKNSIEVGNPVRVIRGHVEKGGKSKSYTFDGMYKVTGFYEQIGQSGFKVFKFKLQRLENQPELTTDQVKFIAGKGVPKSIKDCEGVVCEDLSNGLEAIPIVVTNTIDKDKDKRLPEPFEYIVETIWPPKMEIPKLEVGCTCKGACHPSKCRCAHPTRKEFDYVEDKKGKRLTCARGVVVECGPNCSCAAECTNRNAQLGIRFRLEVFKTANKGWAVRSWDHIPAGAVVCFYVGQIIHEDDLTNFDVYVLDLDAMRTAVHGSRGRESKFGDIAAMIRKIEGNNEATVVDDIDTDEVSKKCEWAIDAAKVGNVARFINHSCDPNLFYQPTLWDHSDINFAHPVLVASENIAPMTELTYDYNYTIDSVTDEEGNIMKRPCYCGAKNCSKRLY